MAVKELYTASERWFTDQAISRSLVSKDQVSKAVADQLMIRHQEGRSVRVWEVLVLNGVMMTSSRNCRSSSHSRSRSSRSNSSSNSRSNGNTIKRKTKRMQKKK